MMTNRRIRAHDNAPRPFKCTVCPQAFKQKGHLVQHMRIHTGTKPYRCELCGYASTIRGNLTAHTKLRHNNSNVNKRTRLRCPHCGLYFKFIDTLHVHIASRHFGVSNTGRFNDNQTMAPASTSFSSPQGTRDGYASNPEMQHLNTSQPEVMPVSIATSLPSINAESVSFDTQVAMQSTGRTVPAPGAEGEIQQWEVVGSANMMDTAPTTSQSYGPNQVMQPDQASVSIYIADDGTQSTSPSGLTSSTDAVVQEYASAVQSSNLNVDGAEVKIESHGFTDCQKEAVMTNSDSNIGFSRTPMQQKLLYASQTKARPGINMDDSSGAACSNKQDAMEVSTDTGFGSSFDVSDNSQDVEATRNTNAVTGQTATECSPSSSNSMPGQANVIGGIKKSMKHVASSSPVSLHRGNISNIASSSPVMRSPPPMSPSSQHSINSPGINATVHSSSQPVPSPCTSQTASPSRRSANKKFKFQNKDSLQCEFCDIVFSDTIMHTIHMGWHNHQSPFMCGVCGKVCRDKYDFMCHFTRGHDS